MKICFKRKKLHEGYVLTVFLTALNLLLYFSELGDIQELRRNYNQSASVTNFMKVYNVNSYNKTLNDEQPKSLQKISAPLKTIDVLKLKLPNPEVFPVSSINFQHKSAEKETKMPFTNKLKYEAADSFSNALVRENSEFDSHPNLLKQNPTKFRPKNYTYKSRDSCKLPYPKNQDLRFNNLYWQLLRTKNWTLYLFGAYYDPRLRILGKGKYDILRIIGIGDKVQIGSGQDAIWCQLWYINKAKPVLTKVVQSSPIWPKKYGFLKDGFHIPYLFRCNLPKADEIPFAVSVVKVKCSKAQNKLKVSQLLPVDKKRKNIAVCVKGLDFPHRDISHKLIEWIELVKLLGASKIYFYEFAVESNTRKVLMHYQSQGIVQIMQFSLPGDFPNDPITRHEYLNSHIVTKRQLEIVPYNDCFYRNINFYDFILPLDIDEIIIPKTVNSWPEMLQIARMGKGLNKTSFNVRQNGCYLDGVERDYFADIPKYMHMLQHIQTVPPVSLPNKSFSGTKGFMDTQRVVTLLNHWPFSCLNQYCRMYTFPTEIAHLQHYKHYHRHCVKKYTKEWNCTKLSCQNFEEDKTIWKYKNSLIPRVIETVSLLNLKYQIE